MKKIIVTFLIIVSVLCTSIFSGCGDKENTGDGTGINTEVVVNYLVKDNASEYSIVVPSDADECLEYSAEELQRYVNLATGVYLPVVKDTDIKGGLAAKAISLGKTLLLESARLDVAYDELNYEGFIIKTVNNTVLIDGAQSTGVLYGVYDFCENYLGIEFLAEDYTYIPTLNEVKIYETDRIQIPAFSHRDYLSYQTMTMPDFSATMRMSSTYNANSQLKYGEGGANINYSGEGHTNRLLLPYEEYGADHSDWYVNAGAEFCYTNGLTEDGEVDMNNTDGMAYNMLQVCKQKILDNPLGRYLTLGQHDNADWCDCQRCSDSDRENGGASGTLMVFINAMAKALDEWKAEENIDREINVVTFAYWKTIVPPVKTENGEIVPYNDKVKARDNVVIRFAHMSCAYHALTDPNCSVNTRFNSYLQGWSAIADHFSIWDYATNFDDYFFWFPNFGSLKSNYQFYREIGVNNVMTQGPTNVSTFYQTRLQMYVTSKLMWNPDQDVNALVKRFNRYYFGEESAEAVDRFVSVMNNHYAILDGTEGFHTDLFSAGKFKDFMCYPKGFLENVSEMILDEIERVEQDPEMSVTEKDSLRKKLLGVYITPQYMLLKNYDAYYDPSGKTEFAKKVFAVIDELQIRSYGEYGNINDLKTQYGLG